MFDDSILLKYALLNSLSVNVVNSDRESQLLRCSDPCAADSMDNQKFTGSGSRFVQYDLDKDHDVSDDVNVYIDIRFVCIADANMG